MEIVRNAVLDKNEIKRIINLNNEFYFFYTKNLIEKIIKKNVLVITKDNLIVGILIFSKKNLCYKINSLVIDKKYRNKGLGTKLLSYFLDRYKPVKIQILATEQSINFWKKFNFVTNGDSIITKKNHKLFPMIYIRKK